MRKTKNRAMAFLFGMLAIFLLCLQALPIGSATPSPVVETVSASAAGNNNVASLPRSDALFEWEQGAFLELSDGTTGELDTAKDLNRLGFFYRILNEDVFKFHLVNSHSDDFGIFQFIVYRSVKESEDAEEVTYPVYEVKLICTPKGIVVAHKTPSEAALIEDATLQVGQLEIYPDQHTKNGGNGQDKIIESYTADDVKAFADDGITDSESRVIGLQYDLLEEGYVLDSFCVHSDDTMPFFTTDKNGYSGLGFILHTNSPHTNYFIASNVIIGRHEGEFEHYWDGPFKYKTRYVYEGYYSNTRSDTRSVKTWVENCNAYGALETELGNHPNLLSRAYDILNNTETKLVTVSYLENIGTSPFARKVTKKIMLPVTNDAIEYHDVCNALKVNNLNTLNATTSLFVKEGVDVYHAEYLSSTRVECKTSDGYKDDYYLDCNKSFKDYYQQYVDLGVFKPQAFEYAFNEMKLKYSDFLAGYTIDEVYGLWGYVVIPQTNTWNQLWKDFFEIPTDVRGTCICYEAKAEISRSQYEALLEDFGYNWLEVLWNKIGAVFTDAGTLYARHYLFYADPDYIQAGIGENGDVDGDGGVIKEEVKDVVENVKDAVQEVIITVQQGVEKTEEAKETAWRTIVIVAGIVGAVAVVFGGIIVYYKYVAPNSRKKK